MRTFWVCAALITALSGCTDPVMLRNPTTGVVTKCGPYWTGLASDFKLTGIAARESQCIQDYQRQGFERAPQ